MDKRRIIAASTQPRWDHCARSQQIPFAVEPRSPRPWAYWAALALVAVVAWWLL